LLCELADDDGAGGIRQPLELFEVLPKVGSGAPALERRSNEERLLNGLFELNRILRDTVS